MEKEREEERKKRKKKNINGQRCIWPYYRQVLNKKGIQISE